MCQLYMVQFDIGNNFVLVLNCFQRKPLLLYITVIKVKAYSQMHTNYVEPAASITLLEGLL